MHFDIPGARGVTERDCANAGLGEVEGRVRVTQRWMPRSRRGVAVDAIQISHSQSLYVPADTVSPCEARTTAAHTVV